MYFIIHETACDNLRPIIKAGMVLKKSLIQSLGLPCGQGCPNRRLTTDPSMSLTNPHFYKKYDEVDGVFFRLIPVGSKIKSLFGGCVLVFDKQLLDDYRFVINTEENFGFYIGPEGVEAQSQFTGEPGITITDIKNLPILNTYQFNPYNTEINIMDSVSIKYMKSLFVPEEKINNDLITLCSQHNLQLYAS